MTSRAVVFDRYGDPDVLHVVDVPVPEPGPGQVRVSVRAAGVQPFDSMFRSGVAKQWMPATFPQRLGNEFAGVVEAVGADVTTVAVGDAVLGWVSLAGYADHVLAGVDEVVAKPAGLPWAEAGVLSASGQTAATALRLLGVADGQTVLVHAAAGGVGSFAVQIARAWGATVIGTASPANHEYLRGLGAIPVAYGDGLVDRVRLAAPRGVDAALVGVSTMEALQTSLELVGDAQRVGAVAFSPVAAELGVRRISTERSAEQLDMLTVLHTAGLLTIPIADQFPLEQAAEAHRRIDGGHVRGKLVLIPADTAG